MQFIIIVNQNNLNNQKEVSESLLSWALRYRKRVDI